MGAHLNGVQAAVLLVLAVMGAGLDGAMDRMVRLAGAAVVGAVAHDEVPPSCYLRVSPEIVCAERTDLCVENLQENLVMLLKVSCLHDILFSEH